MESSEAAAATHGRSSTPRPLIGAVASVRDGALHRLVELALTSPLSHTPAQVVSARVGVDAASWFAIASPPGADRMALLVRRSEPPTRLDALGVGDVLEISGPYGAGFHLDTASRYVLSGVGSAWGALRSAVLALELARVPLDRIAIALGIRRPSDLPDRPELERLASAGAEVVVALSAPGAATGELRPPLRAVPGRVPVAIAALSPFPDERVLGLVAGSDEAETACVMALLARGVPFERIQRNYHPDHRSGARSPMASVAARGEAVAPPAGIEPAQDKD